MATEESIFEKALKSKLDGHHEELNPQVWDGIMSRIDGGTSAAPVGFMERNKNVIVAGVIAFLLGLSLALFLMLSVDKSLGTEETEHHTEQMLAAKESSESQDSKEGVKDSKEDSPIAVKQFQEEASETSYVRSINQGASNFESLDEERGISESSRAPSQGYSNNSASDIASETDYNRSAEMTRGAPSDMMASLVISDEEEEERMLKPDEGISYVENNSDEGSTDLEGFSLLYSSSMSSNVDPASELVEKGSNSDESQVQNGTEFIQNEIEEQINEAPTELEGIVSQEEDLANPDSLAVELIPDTRRRFSADVLLGPSYSYRIFRVESDRVLEDHKNDNERYLASMSYALRLNYAIRPGITAHAGMSYLKFGERYDFTSPQASHSATNSYDYWSVPVGINVRVLGFDKINVDAGLGAQMNFLRSGKSSWVNPHSHSAQEHTHEGSDSPFAETTWGLTAEVGLRYQWSDKLDLLLNEQGVLFQNSIYKEETGIDQREYSFRTSVGLRYWF